MPARRNGPVSSNVRPQPKNQPVCQPAAAFRLRRRYLAVGASERLGTSMLVYRTSPGVACPSPTQIRSTAFYLAALRPLSPVSDTAPRDPHCRPSCAESMPHLLVCSSTCQLQLARLCQAQTQTRFAARNAYPNLRHPRASEPGLTHRSTGHYTACQVSG